MQLQYVYLIVSNMGAPTQEDSLLILKKYPPPLQRI